MSEDRTGKGKATGAVISAIAEDEAGSTSLGGSKRANKGGRCDNEPPVKVIRLQDLQSTVESLVQKVLAKPGGVAGPSAARGSPAVVIATPLNPGKSVEASERADGVVMAGTSTPTSMGAARAPPSVSAATAGTVASNPLGEWGTIVP